MDKKEKKEKLRNMIVVSAQEYAKYLAGKTFLYVYGNQMLELQFKINNFKHLTGVVTCLSSKEFYRRSVDNTLELEQFWFDYTHPFSNSAKKLRCLHRLPELTYKEVCVVRKMNTTTVVYKLGLTNFEFSIGLVEKNGENPGSVYVPMTFRVDSNSLEKSADGEFVDFILMKDSKFPLYDNLVYCDKGKKIPESIFHMLSNDLATLVK